MHAVLVDSSHGVAGALRQGAGAPVDVSIVLPCLDEERSLPHCLEVVAETVRQLAARGYTSEVVIADNGSTDRSCEIALRSGARVESCTNRGYGNALRTGVWACSGRYVIMGDADGSYDFREAIPMIDQLVAGHDVCMGSRFKGRIMPGAMSWLNRYVGNPLLTGILNLFFRSGISDAHCGLRAFSREAFLRLDPRSPGMEFASEMVVRAALLRMRCTEVPVTLWPDRRNGPSHLRPFADGWRHLRLLLGVRLFAAR